MHEGDEPDVVVDLFHADHLPRKHLRHVDSSCRVSEVPDAGLASLAGLGLKELTDSFDMLDHIVRGGSDRLKLS
jgi:hypothetical protein